MKIKRGYPPKIKRWGKHTMKKFREKAISSVIAMALLVGGALTLAEGVRVRAPEETPIKGQCILPLKYWET